ncbi:hypothetical protein [Herbidospora cretacea]|uniref:hypothetical protein n=1 Tax=Herbidospora cretacea TaxID=28444 RepID=UPI0007733626|nr:hypothetical protein [Herbidospora cretacea]
MRGQDSGSEHDHEGKVPPPSFGQSARDESYPPPGDGPGSGWFAAPTARPPQPEWPPAPTSRPPDEPPTWPPAPAREPAEPSGSWFSQPTSAPTADVDDPDDPEEPGATWPTPRSWQPPAPVTEHVPDAPQTDSETPATGHFGFPMTTAAEPEHRSAWPPPVYDPLTEETLDTRGARSAWSAPVHDPETEDTRDRDAAWPVPAYDPETEETRDHSKAGSWPPAQQWTGWPAAEPPPPVEEPEEPQVLDATTSGLPPLPEWPVGDGDRPGEPGDIAVWPPRLPGEENATTQPAEILDDPPVFPRHWPPAAHQAEPAPEPELGVATVPGDRPEGAPWPPAQQWATDTGTRWPSAAIPDDDPAETTIPREEQPAAFKEFDPAAQEPPQSFGVVNGTVTDIPTDPELPVQKVDPHPEPTKEDLFTPPVPPAAPVSPGRGFESLGAAPTVAEGIVHPPLPKGYRPAEAAPVAEPPAKKSGGARKVLMAGGAAVVIAAIGASAYMAYSGEDDTPGEAAAPPATAPPAAPGGQVADPEPTVEAAVLDSETTDPRKLTLAEAFPAAKVTVNGRTYKRVKVNITDDCAAAAAGAFAKSLSDNDCRRVLRATYVDGKKQYAVTTGIAVLPTKEAALTVDQTKNLGSNLWFRGLNGDAESGADRVAISGGYAAGMVWGRYIVFSYATYADGHTPGEKEKDLGPVSGGFRDQTAEIIEKRVTS